MRRTTIPGPSTTTSRKLSATRGSSYKPARTTVAPPLCTTPRRRRRHCRFTVPPCAHELLKLSLLILLLLFVVVVTFTHELLQRFERRSDQAMDIVYSTTSSLKEYRDEKVAGCYGQFVQNSCGRCSDKNAGSLFCLANSECARDV